MKTILFSDNHVFSLNHFRRGVINYFIKKGYKVIALAPETNDLDDNSILGVKYIPIRLNRTSTSLLEIIFYFFSLYKNYKKNKPDIIFHYTIKPIIFGSIAARLVKIPSIALFAGLNEKFRKRTFVSMMARKFLKLVLVFPRKIIFLNDGDMTYLISQNIISREKCILFPGGEGLDTDYYKPLPFRSGEHLVFLMVARVLYTKGYSEFVEAAKRIKKIHASAEFILCGEIDSGHPASVPAEDIYQAHSEGIIKYEGRVSNILEKLHKCDCFILPSYYNEGMNRSIMEAISTATPVITTNNKGCKEMVIDGKSGFIIKKQNVESLVEAILKFYAFSQSEKEKMGNKARQLAVNRFSERLVIENYKKIVDEITME